MGAHESIWDEIAKNKLLIVVEINSFDDACLMIFCLLELISHNFLKIDFASNILKDMGPIGHPACSTTVLLLVSGKMCTLCWEIIHLDLVLDGI